MARHFIDDHMHWYERAEESRAMAEQMRDLQAKATMLKIADSYQHLADHAMKRAKREL